MLSANRRTKAMKTDYIAEIGIDEQKRLYLRPSSTAFPSVCRLCAEVYWEPTSHHIHCRKRREWTYMECFQHIMHCAMLQSYELQITPHTVWTNVPANLSAEMKCWCDSRTADVACYT